jgi:hypothetical protein
LGLEEICKSLFAVINIYTDLLDTSYQEILNRFRWLECQLALINKLRTEKEIRHALTVLPQTLFESYDRLLELIDGKYAELVMKVLHLVIVFPTVAPCLPVHTILDGISSIDERGYIDRSATFLDSRILLQECGVLLRENGDYFQTCHYSVEVCHCTCSGFPKIREYMLINSSSS